MASIWEKAISILAGNLNSGCSYLITAVCYCANLMLGLFLEKKEDLQDKNASGVENCAIS